MVEDSGWSKAWTCQKTTDMNVNTPLRTRHAEEMTASFTCMCCCLSLWVGWCLLSHCQWHLCRCRKNENVQVSPFYTEIHFLEVLLAIDTLYDLYFHFCYELALESSAKCSSIKPFRVHDLCHAHSLVSLQWSGPSDQ